jgi:hypothetical protein
VVLHTGVTPPHCAFEVQGTQVPVVVRQAGVLPVQSLALVAEQTPQAPEAWQAGAAPPQSLSPPQARQACIAVLHTGVVPPHCALEVQETQLPAAVLHTGVAPEHWAELVAEHWPQAPDGWQAGAAPPHSLSPAQARQLCVVVLHTGVAPPHWAFDVQATQLADGV